MTSCGGSFFSEYSMTPWTRRARAKESSTERRVLPRVTPPQILPSARVFRLCFCDGFMYNSHPTLTVPSLQSCAPASCVSALSLSLFSPPLPLPPFPPLLSSSSRLELNHPTGPDLVQNSEPALPAPDGILQLELVHEPAVAAPVEAALDLERGSGDGSGEGTGGSVDEHAGVFGGVLVFDHGGHF